MESCLRNKISVIIVFFVFCFCVTSCSEFLLLYYAERSMAIREVNESNSDVVFLAPLNFNKVRRLGWGEPYLSWGNDYFRWINMNQLDISDTTMINYALTSVYGDNGIVKAGKDESVWTYYSTLEEMVPYDTMRVFVYDGLFRQDPYGPLAGNLVPIENDLYFVRYDISIEDARKLINDKGELEIHFPPDERMKDIKMWPRYEDVISVKY